MNSYEWRGRRKYDKSRASLSTSCKKSEHISAESVVRLQWHFITELREIRKMPNDAITSMNWNAISILQRFNLNFNSDIFINNCLFTVRN